MKRIFKKSNIFSFILGSIVFGSIGAYAAYSVLASDIGYTPSDTTWKKANGEDITNVKDAIDDLYKIKRRQKHAVNEQVFSLGKTTTKTFDIKLLTDDYANLSTENFFYTASFYASGKGLEKHIEINYNYDSETGILTVSSEGLYKPGYYYAFFENIKFYYFD